MAWIKLDPTTREVIQKSCSPEAGFVSAPDYVTCGMFEQPDGSYLAPPTPQKTWQERRAKEYHVRLDPLIIVALGQSRDTGVIDWTAVDAERAVIRSEIPKV